MIYLDNHSTTPCDPRVFMEIEPYFTQKFGNSASVHSMGDEAKETIELARERVAELINADPEEIFFTNSATEANNIVLKNLCEPYCDHNGNDCWRRIITTNVEHSSIKNTINELPFVHIPLKIKSDGNINTRELRKVIGKYSVVSIIYAQNEIGTIFPIERIAKICSENGVPFHTDATQAIGKVKIDVKKIKVDYLTGNGHKIYGIKGCGFLYIRKGRHLNPILHGGKQSVISSGTQNTPAIVGLGKACEILKSQWKKDYKHTKELRDWLLGRLQTDIPDLIINGTMKNRLPSNLNITIPSVKAEILVKGLDGICISGGSACESGNLDVSPVIKALGTPYPECAVRFGLGRFNTWDEVKIASGKIIKAVKELRS